MMEVGSFTLKGGSWEEEWVPRLGWPLGRQLRAQLLLVENAGRVRLPDFALVPVANVFPALAAIGPNIVLNETRKVGREGRIELPAVNSGREVVYDSQAPFLGVAPGSIGVVELVTAKYPGPVEEVVDEGVYRDHVLPDPPVVPPGVSGQEEARQGHVGELRADIRNGCDFPNEAVEEVGDGATSLSKVLGHVCVKVSPSHIPEEEIKRKRHVVQCPAFHVKARKWTGPQEGGFVALAGRFSVASPLEGLETG
jgi:hypothetical protein